MKPEVGRVGSLSIMRNYLQKECGMLQVWAGKTPQDDDYITFVSENAEYYAVLYSAASTTDYTISIAGDVVYMHQKNLLKLAEMAR